MRNCLNCKYSRDVGPYLACYGQKNAPRVDWDDVCEDWKSKYYVTNANRIRSMSDEELAKWLVMVERRLIKNALSKPFNYTDEQLKADWLDWLKKEVDNA